MNIRQDNSTMSPDGDIDLSGDISDFLHQKWLNGEYVNFNNPTEYFKAYNQPYFPKRMLNRLSRDMNNKKLSVQSTFKENINDDLYDEFSEDLLDIDTMSEKELSAYINVLEKILTKKLKKEDYDKVLAHLIKAKEKLKVINKTKVEDIDVKVNTLIDKFNLIVNRKLPDRKFMFKDDTTCKISKTRISTLFRMRTDILNLVEELKEYSNESYLIKNALNKAFLLQDELEFRIMTEVWYVQKFLLKTSVLVGNVDEIFEFYLLSYKYAVENFKDDEDMYPEITNTHHKVLSERKFKLMKAELITATEATVKNIYSEYMDRFNTIITRSNKTREELQDSLNSLYIIRRELVDLLYPLEGFFNLNTQKIVEELFETVSLRIFIFTQMLSESDWKQDLDVIYNIIDRILNLSVRKKNRGNILYSDVNDLDFITFKDTNDIHEHINKICSLSYELKTKDNDIRESNDNYLKEVTSKIDDIILHLLKKYKKQIGGTNG